MTLRSIFTAGALVSFGVILSRVLGLLRELLLASHYGAGHEADMAVALLVLPDFITGALISSAVSATLVPLFTVRGNEDAQRLLWQALALSFAVFTVLTLLVSSDAGGIVNLIEHDADHVPGASLALVIALATIPLTAATSILTAYLQYQHRFMVPAFAHAVFNGVIVLFLWLAPSSLALLAGGIMAGVLVRLLMHVYSAFRGGVRVLPHFWRPWQITRKMTRNYATTMATDICNLFPQIAPYYLVAATGSGLAVFNYAFRLSLMPAMIGQNVAQMVMLPWFSRLARDAGDSKVPHYSITLQCAWAICLAFCLTLTMASHEVAEVCFGYGKMDTADIDRVSQLFALGVWCMPPILLTGIWQQLHYAHGKPRMPLVSSAVQAVVIMPLCLIGRQLYGLEGIMLAFTMLFWIAAGWLAYAGYRQGIISHYLPSAVYGKMSTAALALWVPLSWLYRGITANIWLKMLLAMGIGAVIMAAAVALCDPVRQWGMRRIKAL